MTRVAVHQLAPVLGDLEGNRARAAAAIEAAAAAGADVVVLPELVTSGYVFEGPDEAWPLAEPADGPTLQAWARLAAAHDLVIAGGFAELGEDGATLYNSAALVDASGVRAVYRKAHLWDREPECFRPGDARAAGGRHAARPDRADGLLRPRVPRVGPRGRARGRRAALRADQLARRAAAGRRAADGGPQDDGPRGHEPDGDRRLRPLRGRARRRVGQRQRDRRPGRLAARRAARPRARAAGRRRRPRGRRATRRSGRATTSTPTGAPPCTGRRCTRLQDAGWRRPPPPSTPSRCACGSTTGRACSAASRPRSARPAARSATSCWSRSTATTSCATSRSTPATRRTSAGSSRRSAASRAPRSSTGRTGRWSCTSAASSRSASSTR